MSEPTPAPNWFFKVGSYLYGPMSLAELRQKAAAGEIRRNTPVRKIDDVAWVSAERVEGLFQLSPTPRANIPPPLALPSATPLRPPLDAETTNAMANNVKNAVKFGAHTLAELIAYGKKKLGAKWREEFVPVLREQWATLYGSVNAEIPKSPTTTTLATVARPIGNAAVSSAERALSPVSESAPIPAKRLPATNLRLFDLNIETVLEHWEVEHGLREIIANALDECRLSRTAPIDISKDERGRWHIRDYGRGIQIKHFTLNENVEKMGADGVIGKFGVGLKDALATLDRHHVKVSIRSPHGAFTLTKASKHDFDGITTLHISHEPGDPATRGTDFVLTGVPDDAIEKAKSMFLCFREHRVLDTTPVGQVIAALPAKAHVFINGVWVNAEPTFLFSYNVTTLTDSMRKALNRERVNVGRSVYAERVRQILKSSNAADVLGQLASAYARREEGELPEELHWIDIAHKALNELARRRKVVAISQTEIKSRPELVEDIKRDGNQIVLLSDREKQRADEQARKGEAPFHTLGTWIRSRNDSFQYRFVEEDRFTQNEMNVWRQWEQILGLLGVKRWAAPRILVSETMSASEDETEGVWDRNLRAIIVKRTQLRSVQAFAGTLLHEFGHANTGTFDCTRSFENVLTEYLGRVSARALLTTAPNATESSSQVNSQIARPSSKPPIVIKGIEFMPVKSSAVAGVAYDDKTRTLYVALKKGVQYVYQSVPEAVCNDFLNAESKGRYLPILFNGYRYQEMK